MGSIPFMTRPRGRYAPSPTGEVHLGNASSALLAWLSIRARSGTFVMRMEDLDRPRVRPGLAGRILDDLAWLGLDWDEGPDRGGPHAPYDQGSRGALYRVAFERLREAGRVYPCFCSRSDVAAAASAPQLPGEERRYPGTCRGLTSFEVAERLQRGARHAWRFRVERDACPRFLDLVHGPWGAAESPPGDFVVWRSDEVAAYQVAVVVDDVAMEIDEVVRGADLLPSTAKQLLLYEALGHSPPAFGHVPLLLGTDGARLSKRHAGTTLRELRERGLTPERIVGGLAYLLGLRRSVEPVSARSLADGFRLDRLRPVAGGLVADASTWR